MAAFRLELDYVLHFVPPMTEHSGGIVLTWTVELPFAPFEKLHLFAKDLEDCPYPPGLSIREVCWDLDRECFLAVSEMTFHGPVAEIPWILSSLRDRGWRPGSFQKYYHADDEPEQNDNHSVNDDSGNAYLDFDELEQMEQIVPRKRPKALNELIKAMVRAMVESGDDNALAYALDRTGLVFTESEARHSEDESAQKWLHEYQEFDRLSDEEWTRWRRKVDRYRDIFRVEPIEP